MVRCPVCKNNFEVVFHQQRLCNCKKFKMWICGSFWIQGENFKFWSHQNPFEWRLKKKGGEIVSEGSCKMTPQEAKEFLDRWKKLESFE